MDCKRLLYGVLLSLAIAAVVTEAKKGVTRRETRLSPAFELGPGDVTDRYQNLDFPAGHVALRSFDAEVVDENERPVALTELYLHHWVVLRLYVKKGHKQLLSSEPRMTRVDPASNGMVDRTDGVSMKHSERMQFHPEAHPIFLHEKQGSCDDNPDAALLLGKGSETRWTNSSIPAPYGLVIGDPAAIPEGYEEAWYLNIHGIDTRGAVSAKACLECLCASYGVTVDSKGQPLKADYVGGLSCCYDKTHCVVKPGFRGEKKRMYLKYTMNLADFDETVRPVRTYCFDATAERTSLEQKPVCKVEYNVKQCSPGSPKSECVDRRITIGAVPKSGYLIRGAAHQHSGALGTNLYRKDGSLICSSNPIYGHGTAPGDEAGYVVGMTTCYPEPGSVYLEAWEELTLESFYSTEQSHTGVMSLFGVTMTDFETTDSIIEEVV